MTMQGPCCALRDRRRHYAEPLDLRRARRHHAGLAGFLAATALGSCLGLSVVPASAAEVTYQRLLNASSEPQNWLMRMGNYSNWNHSALKEINRGNVANLKVKFMFSLGDPSRPNKATEYFTPLVEDGFMYVGNQWHQYWKLDVRNEKPTVVWKYDAKVQGGGKSAHSVTLYGNNVYLNTGNDTSVPRLIALDKDSGQVVFDVNTTAPEVAPNQGHSGAPLAVKNMILIGQSNRGENGRGYVAAYTADTGKLLWRFLVVPDPGQPGSETWADPRTIPTGGGGVWTEPSFDPETNLAYYGTANPVHMFDPQGRPGDNLYTNSIIALDVDTGKLKWYFQTIPNESWDYDSVAITQLYDVNIGGELRKVIGQTNRNGFYYELDRTNGQFLRGQPFTTVNWTAGLDPKTGRPLDYDPSKTIQDYAGKAVRYGKKAIDVRPAHYGMPTLMPNAYDPSRGITYFNAMIGEANYFNSRPADPAKQLIGTGFREIYCGVATKENAVEPIERSVRNPNCRVSHGLLGGIDVRTGNTVKKLESYYPAYSGVLGTDGGLIFMGDIMGKISAFDKDTMQELWHFETGTAFAGSPMTFAVNGKQYVALITGGRLGRDEGSFPEAAELGQNVILMVFGL
ncbi:MAG TPA: PQQ-binding-like beta-propeller repeat protein [Xanthobacteraceae bacterium]|jgi:alcohol dehydrogenase (cytochrome c)|nr:PQQ-binding-like beta-propeller repeat protein [Xanthobacteraceae bacterium]